jgi:alanine dehydrogenase
MSIAHILPCKGTFMKVGVPKEVKNGEFRVGLTPDGARELIASGAFVSVQASAGSAIGFADADYIAAGCQVVQTADEIFNGAELIIKVKEPQPEEIGRLRPHHTLFTYLHLAPDPHQAKGLMESGATCIAYETVTDASGRLPLLVPMSEVAGRLSVQVGCRYLEIGSGGAGVLLGGVTGVAPARVTVIGGGTAGVNAAQMAMGLGAQVTVFDKSYDRIRHINDIYQGRMQALYASASAIGEAVAASDLLIGAVLIPGAAAPKVVSRSMIDSMRRGSVIVDIAIDQGGCFETSRPTSHQDPVYVVGGVTHYCVTNMPAAVARTSTLALTTATLPFAIQLVRKGPATAMMENVHLAAGLNVRSGRICHPEVAEALSGVI